MRSLGCSGSPLSGDAYRWIYRQFPQVFLAVGCGGTDVAGGIVGSSPAAAPLRRRDAVPLARRRRRRLRQRGPPARRRGGRDDDRHADAVDAARLLERRGRRALPRNLLLDGAGEVAPGRLAAHHAARRRRGLRALGRDHQAARRAHGHRGALPRHRGGARGARLPGGGPGIPRPAVLHAAVRAAASRRRAGRGAEGAHRARPSAPRSPRASCPTRSSPSRKCRAP